MPFLKLTTRRDRKRLRADGSDRLGDSSRDDADDERPIWELDGIQVGVGGVLVDHDYAVLAEHGRVVERKGTTTTRLSRSS
jgi:hypothetical protein